MYCHAPCEKNASTHSHTETGVMSVRSFYFRSPADAKDFSSGLCVQTSSEAHSASYPMGAGGGFFPRVKRGRGVTLTSDPHLVSRSRMRSYTPLPLGVCMSVAGQLYFYFTYLCPYISVVSVGRVLISAPPPRRSFISAFILSMR
jgi:hypothetical protein